MKGEGYEAILEKSPGFNNPNCVTYLSELLGVPSTHCSNFLTLRYLIFWISNIHNG